MEGNKISTLALRITDKTFDKANSGLLKKSEFEVHGTQNISELLLKDVQKRLDRFFCLQVQYKFDGNLQDEKINCTELFSYGKAKLTNLQLAGLPYHRKLTLHEISGNFKKSR